LSVQPEDTLKHKFLSPQSSWQAQQPFILLTEQTKVPQNSLYEWLTLNKPGQERREFHGWQTWCPALVGQLMACQWIIASRNSGARQPGMRQDCTLWRVKRSLIASVRNMSLNLLPVPSVVCISSCLLFLNIYGRFFYTQSDFLLTICCCVSRLLSYSHSCCFILIYFCLWYHCGCQCQHYSSYQFS
jgi:hypothetical protein